MRFHPAPVARQRSPSFEKPESEIDLRQQFLEQIVI
jgi:hypothetical protein